MQKRTNYSSGAPWEQVVGYSRAVKSGHLIEVSGTIALDDEGNSTGIDDPYQQTIEIIRIAKRVWEEVGRAHGEFFREIKPATSMIEVSALIRPESMVEIEFTANLL